jgi:predicted MPP superfamily phosphohydrolase
LAERALRDLANAYDHVVENEQHLFVTSGVGTSVFPVRFLVPPEIAMFTLQSAARSR